MLIATLPIQKAREVADRVAELIPAPHNDTHEAREVVYDCV